MIENLKNDLNDLSNPEKAKLYQRFFKTGKGEYGEGDVFIGLTVPEQRSIAKKYIGLPLKGIQELLDSRIHEHRLVALLILVEKFRKSKSEDERKGIYSIYLKNTKRINNWDLVDLSAHRIVGAYLENKKKDILYKLAKSSNLWEKRISIISTAWFVKNGQFSDTLKISEILLKDNHDLIHKAVGWMLREVGNRDQEAEESFLKKYHKTMPRTMLRYSIEKFDRDKREFYMRK